MCLFSFADLEKDINNVDASGEHTADIKNHAAAIGKNAVRTGLEFAESVPVFGLAAKAFGMLMDLCDEYENITSDFLDLKTDTQMYYQFLYGKDEGKGMQFIQLVIRQR